MNKALIMLRVYVSFTFTFRLTAVPQAVDTKPSVTAKKVKTLVTFKYHVHCRIFYNFAEFWHCHFNTLLEN